jgi:thiamine biosynthesis lipoprotein
MNRYKLYSAFLLLSLAFLSGCQGQKLYSDERLFMGTFIKIISPDQGASAIAFSQFKEVDERLSKYKEGSEISLLNKLKTYKVSKETMELLKESKEFWAASSGAFDITVAPLMQLWGFKDKRFRQPSGEEISATLQRIGSDKIILDFDNNVVKLQPDMELDLGAIAKGYAIDCAVAALKSAGIKSCLINAGGEIYCMGDKFGKPWRVGIQDPRGKGLIEYIELKDEAVSTSGDYEQYFVRGNKRFSHIMDPTTGYPADSGVIAVTVIAPDGTTADALSTAIFVMGKEKAAQLMQRYPKARFKIIEKKGME